MAETPELEVSPGEDDIQSGSPLPIGGPHQQGDGVCFVLFSRHATGVRLDLYRHPDDSSPARTIDFDPVRHRTGDIWHVWVRGIAAGQLYGYRVEGPYQPEEGHRFNPHKLLLDPYARAIAGVRDWNFSATRGYDSSSRLTDLSISTVEKHKEIHRFTRGMIAFRRAHPVLRKEKFYTDEDIKWFAPDGATPHWADPWQKSFACLILRETEPDLFLLFNADTSAVDFYLPALPTGKIWRLAVDTSRTAPDDLFDLGKEPPVQGQNGFRLEPRSSAILITDNTEATHDN